ncbi:hypothetical protein NM897_17385 (plasmid) [Planococcus maritimus]|uniref:hypothetical protein n=1 Tax=Planococcus maritimus TaxID=192421 RepID=UPI0031396322
MEEVTNWRGRISKESLEYLKDFALVKGLKKPNKALDYILKDYADLEKQRFDLRFVANSLKEEIIKEVRLAVKEEVAEEMKRIRLGTNNTDRNTQVIIELLQAKLVADNNNTLIFTDTFKPEFLEEAEAVVQERISNKVQKKHSSN